MFNSDDRSSETCKARKLWRNYVVALFLIAAFLLGSHAVSTYALNSGINEAELINTSGRQRMLSQRILYFAVLHSDRPTLQTFRNLREAVDLFERSHFHLAEHAGVPEELRAIYFEPDRDGVTLHQLSQDYVANARELIIQSDDALDDALAMLQTYGPTSLLTRLDSAVTAFENKAETRAANLRMI